MKVNRKASMKLTVTLFALAFVFTLALSADAQIQGAGGGYYVAGYPTIYGSFGQASAAQSRLYDKVRAQKRSTAAQKEPARNSPSAAARPRTNSVQREPAAPPRVVRNYGKYRPDASVDSGKLLADNLGETPDEKGLIKEIFTATKTAFDQEAATRGFKNNIAGGLTFFTVAAVTVYHEGEEPTDEAVREYFAILNAAMDEIPEFASVPNKEKQGFNDMLVGFSGIILATYSEAKQTGDPETLASAKKLAGTLIEMVLQTNPENIRVENGRIVMN